MNNRAAEPLLTLGVVSCNRFHYLKALIESARQCLDFEGIQWIVADNASIETGVSDYIESLEFVEHKILHPRREPARELVRSFNQIVERASGRFFLFLPDDVQFVFRGKWLLDAMALAATHADVGSIVIDAQRRPTIDRFFPPGRFARWLRLRGEARRYDSENGAVTLFSYGDQKPGITPAFNLALVRTDIVKAVGPIVAKERYSVHDPGSGFENAVLARYAELEFALERWLLRVPLMASIVTDMRGTQARVRGNRRYGAYFPPPEGTFYYRIRTEAEYRAQPRGGLMSFEDVVEPLGFELPFDRRGHLLKQPLTEKDAFEWIDPRVAGIDI